MDSIDVRKALWVSPPRAYGAAGPNGQPIVVATSTSATYLELDTTTFGQSYSMGTSMLVSGLGAPSGAPQGLMGCFISIYADAQDLGVIFGQTLASVTGSNVPALAQNGASLTAGVYTGAAGVCYRIAAGTSLRVLTQVGIDKYLAWVAAGTGQIRIYQSSAVGLDG